MTATILAYVCGTLITLAPGNGQTAPACDRGMTAFYLQTGLGPMLNNFQTYYEKRYSEPFMDLVTPTEKTVAMGFYSVSQGRLKLSEPCKPINAQVDLNMTRSDGGLTLTWNF